MKNTRLRLTLREFWIKALNKPIEINEVINEYTKDNQYLTTLSKDLHEYPRLIRKPIKHHEKTLLKITHSGRVNDVTPLLRYVDGEIIGLNGLISNIT